MKKWLVVLAVLGLLLVGQVTNLGKSSVLAYEIGPSPVPDPFSISIGS